MRHAIPLVCALTSLLAAVPYGCARAEWDAGMIARQRGDFAAAYREIRPEAEAGAADAQEVLGQMLLRGQGVARDEATAVQWFRRAAENGSVPGMLAYGTAALRGNGMPRDEALGIQWLTRAATAGNPAAILLLGECYERGNGVPRNVVATHDWFLKAAQSGSAEGMLRLANLLLSPIAGANDDRAGMEWLTKAAEAGQMTAQSQLALILAAGTHGVARNETDAVGWAQKAAFKDHDASALLCRLYGRGINGQPPDANLAFRWCTVAAESGVPDAMPTLAGLYLDGKGTTRDPQAALVWALIGAARASGSAQQEAIRVRESAARFLTEIEQQVARTKAGAWRPLP